MYWHIATLFPHKITGAILGVSGLEGFLPLIDESRSEIHDTRYPEVDMERLPFKEASFDYVISDQVLEHLEDPVRAVRESYRVLKKGGIAIHTTCFVNYYHPSPLDFWRFSPDALRHLCSDFSEILQCAGWGNRAAVFLCMLGDRFRALEIPDRPTSILRAIASRNNPQFPIVTWIIARK
jgi:SAM-dependent methyltransferase